MVFLTGTSPIVASQCDITLLKRTTSTSTTGNDLMNTAFYEPDIDLECELKRITSDQPRTEKKDYWESRLDDLTDRYPFLMLQFIPLLMQLLLILFISSVVFISGISEFSDKCAARLYYFLLCCIF